jgi:hypothetical protein
MSSQTAIQATAIRSSDMHVLLHLCATVFGSDDCRAHDSVVLFRTSYIQAS